MSSIVNTMNSSVIAKAIASLAKINRFLIDVQLDKTSDTAARNFAAKQNAPVIELKLALEYAMKFDDVRINTAKRIWDLSDNVRVSSNAFADFDEKWADVAIEMAIKARNVRRDVEQEVFALPGFRESLVA